MRYILVLALFISGSCVAQVNFLFNASVAGKDMRGLSTLQLVNSSRNTYDGNLEIEVRNAENNLPVVRLFITGVNIKPGNNQIPFTLFKGATVYYSSGSAGEYVRQTGIMPEGELEYCFKLHAAAKDVPAEVFENCFTGTATIRTPLELTSPDNGEEICNKRPRLSWQPPLPLNPAMSYTVKLSQKLDGQSANDALIVNAAIVYQTNIRGQILTYPAGSPELKEGNHYVWQVTGEAKGSQIFSEIWEFTVACHKQMPSKKSFRELTSTDDGSFLSTGSLLQFAITNAYTAEKLRYSIVDLSKPGKPFARLPEIVLQRGANNISIDLRKIPGIDEETEYQLRVVLPDGSKISLRFKYSDDYE